jgi:rhodanese-related sulfurtransferase
MKRFVRDLAGGVAIIAAAFVVGLLHNAVRGQSIPLIQDVQPVQTVRHGNGGDGDLKDNPVGSASQSLPDGAVSVDQVAALLEAGEAYVIDARGTEAYNEGHIPGSINVPYDRLSEYYGLVTATVPTDAKVICYCWSPTCDFSDQLATELKIMGYTDVTVFTGGWEHWQQAGHPVESNKTGD